MNSETVEIVTENVVRVVWSVACAVLVVRWFSPSKK